MRYSCRNNGPRICLLALCVLAHARAATPGDGAATLKPKEKQNLRYQKIRAIQYLAKIGCRCYDKRAEITEALQASLSDYDEEVRLATVQALIDTASVAPCEECGSSMCRNKALLKQISKIAWDVDDQGCWIEKSERLRELAVRAGELCCPYQEP